MLKRILAFVILFLLLTLNFATSPIPSPYYSYWISGSVVCDTLEDLSNYSVVLYGFNSQQQFNGSHYVIVEGMGNMYEKPISVTTRIGEYFIKVDAFVLFDSIKVCVISKNSTVVYGTPHTVDSSALTEITETYTKPIVGVSCSACSVEPRTGKRTVNYIYKLSNELVNICE